MVAEIQPDYRPGRDPVAMPIEWDSVPDAVTVGAELVELMREVWPFPRSLTGDGVRDTLRVLQREAPLELVETPSGTPVFDWTVPREWRLRGAWIDGPDGRVVDAADSPLHVLGYSTPVDTTLTLDELREHVFTHEDEALVPYRTSYWTEQWGFCMSRRQLDALEPGEYRVSVDAELVEGSLTSGELTIPGETRDEFLLSTHVCHPALANDNLSGVAVLWALARTLGRQRRLRHTFRLLWSPGTLGPLCWLHRNLETLDRVRHGLVISCVGDRGPLRYKRSRRGEATVDRAAAHVLGRVPGSLVSAWQPTGGDERQWCSPGFDLPVGTLSRTPHGLFPEYHSSADDITFVTPEALGASLRTALEIVDLVERNACYRNTSPYGEPQLGRRGLYQSVPDGTNPERAYLWLLSLSDGSHDLLEIAERSGLSFAAVHEAAGTLEQHGLLEPCDDEQT
jgi:aminopeptidase-like protein